MRSCTGEPAVYEEMGSMAFVNGYITVMAVEMDSTKVSILLHLQELMEDREAYGWEVVRSYHAAWLHNVVPLGLMKGRI